MECPFDLEPDCDYVMEYELLTIALDEAEELRTALNAEVHSLWYRVRQLERYILDAGLPLPTEA